MITALSKSCKTPAKISLAEALLRFMRTVIGTSEATIGRRRELIVLFDLLIRPLVFNNPTPRGVRTSNILMALFNNPPELPRKSITKPIIPFLVISTMASLNSLAVFFENFLIRMYPILFSSNPQYGTSFNLIFARVNSKEIFSFVTGLNIWRITTDPNSPRINSEASFIFIPSVKVESIL